MVMYGSNQGQDPNAGGGQSYADQQGAYQPPPNTTGTLTAQDVGSSSLFAQIQAALNDPLGPNFLPKALNGVPWWALIALVVIVPGGVLYLLARLTRRRTPKPRMAK